MNNSNYPQSQKCILKDTVYVALLDIFQWLYMHTAFSQSAKICPLLKSLGSKLVRILCIVIWIWMYFLACSPCIHRAGKETLCSSLPCDGFFFSSVLVNHMISRHIRCVANTGAPFRSEHPQGCKICKGTVVWTNVLADCRSPQLMVHLKVWDEIQLLWES